MKILLIGSNGKMGNQMQRLLQKKNIEFFGVDKENRLLAKNCDADVVLDFSSATCLPENLEVAKSKNIPIVIGTTNHDEKNLKLIDEFKNSVPIFLSSNFSIMFNVFLNMLENLESVKNCDFAVSEIHHKNKKDMPSGSCKEILKLLAKFDISAQVSCLRVGEIVGTHEVSAYSETESLQIKHQAYDRQVFCEGALKACEFVVGKQNGVYSMKDLLKAPATLENPREKT